MTTHVTITVDTFVDQSFPVGTVAGNLVYDVIKPDGSIANSQVSAASSVTFDLDPGDYVASCQRLDSAGSRIGGAATMPFNVSVPLVTVSVPNHLTVAM